jgi:hypothetical protein
MNKVPITLQATPVTVGVSYSDINGLLQIVASNLSAFISQTVSFYAQGPVTPSTFITSQFFNTAQNLWYGWDTGSGRYLPITQYVPGDTKTSFVTGDNPTAGWVLCNGRAISAVPNLSQYQVAILQNLFGAQGNLPNIAPLQSLIGLPANLAFSGISNPTVAPPAGQIGALTFPNNPVQPADVQPLAQNCETLDGSVIALQTAVAAVITQSEAVLESLNAGSSTGLNTFVFCGYS